MDSEIVIADLASSFAIAYAVGIVFVILVAFARRAGGR